MSPTVQTVPSVLIAIAWFFPASIILYVANTFVFIGTFVSANPVASYPHVHTVPSSFNPIAKFSPDITFGATCVAYSVLLSITLTIAIWTFPVFPSVTFTHVVPSLSPNISPSSSIFAISSL